MYILVKYIYLFFPLRVPLCGAAEVAGSFTGDNVSPVFAIFIEQKQTTLRKVIFRRVVCTSWKIYFYFCSICCVGPRYFLFYFFILRSRPVVTNYLILEDKSSGRIEGSSLANRDKLGSGLSDSAEPGRGHTRITSH